MVAREKGWFVREKDVGGAKTDVEMCVKNKNLQAEKLEGFAVRTGLEPVTPCVTGMYSNQLN